jgi:hypothetical protein
VINYRLNITVSCYIVLLSTEPINACSDQIAVKPDEASFSLQGSVTFIKYNSICHLQDLFFLLLFPQYFLTIFILVKRTISWYE